MRLHLSENDRYLQVFDCGYISRDYKLEVTSCDLKFPSIWWERIKGRGKYLKERGTMGDKKALVPAEVIVRKILFLRGEKVLLDRDLAELYGVETRVLNQAVSRNKKRFPEDFMFTLAREEIKRISQSVTSSKIKYSKRVTAFTEQGVAMLSSVLRSKNASLVNVRIIRTFVKMRIAISGNQELARKMEQLEYRLDKHDGEIVTLFEAIEQLIDPIHKKKKLSIGFRLEKR